MADIGFDLQQVVRVTIEHTSMKAHHLHEPDSAAVADRLGLQPRILRNQYSSQQTRRDLQFPSFLDDRTRDPVCNFSIGPAAKDLGQR
jgi:hypothetical protein